MIIVIFAFLCSTDHVPFPRLIWLFFYLTDFLVFSEARGIIVIFKTLHFCTKDLFYYICSISGSASYLVV